MKTFGDTGWFLFFKFLNICTTFTLLLTGGNITKNDPIPNDLKSFLVYKFTCASCSSRYIGETCRHFKTRIEEHIKKDYKH